MNRIIVSADGNGDYKTVREALDNALQGSEIFIKNGTYKEKIIISTPNIKIVGEDKEKTIITYSAAALDLDEEDQAIGTFATATVHVMPSAVGFSAQQITFENSAGMGDLVGQAIALYIDCDKAVIENCILKARQDTLLTAPYFKDIEENPDLKNRQYFKDCLIEGDVDFIFGGAVAIFEDCEIKSLDRQKELNGYVTAACTSKNLKFGLVFMNCNFTTDSCADETVSLGRPWREYANTVMINCNYGKHISRKGFFKWNNTNRHETCYYAQYAGKGFYYNEAEIAEWTHILTKEQAEEYTIENIFEGWIPKCQ